MRTIRISDAVWQEIAERGKFGETPNMVLERVFGLAREEAPKREEKKDVIRLGTLYTLNELDRVELGKDTRPERLHLEGEVHHVRNWVEVCERLVEWLIKKGHLTASKCPVPTGSERTDKYFINTAAVHRIREKDGDWREIGGFFVDVKYNAFYHVKNIRGAMRHLGVHDSGIRLSFRE